MIILRNHHSSLTKSNIFYRFFQSMCQFYDHFKPWQNRVQKFILPFVKISNNLFLLTHNISFFILKKLHKAFHKILCNPQLLFIIQHFLYCAVHYYYFSPWLLQLSPIQISNNFEVKFHSFSCLQEFSYNNMICHNSCMQQTE